MNRSGRLSKSFVGLALLFVLCGKIASAEVHLLPDDTRAVLIKGRDVTIVKKVSLIPPAALVAVRASQDDHAFKMADAKMPFQVTDTITDATLPSRQLQFAAISPDYVLIHYARGGIALGYYFLLLKKAGHNYKVVWRAEGPQCSSYHRFLRELKANTIDDRAGYLY